MSPPVRPVLTKKSPDTRQFSSHPELQPDRPPLQRRPVIRQIVARSRPETAAPASKTVASGPTDTAPPRPSSESENSPSYTSRITSFKHARLQASPAGPPALYHCCDPRNDWLSIACTCTVICEGELAWPPDGAALGSPPCGLSTAKACPPLSLTPPVAWIEGGSSNFVNGGGVELSPLPPNKLASPEMSGLRPSPPPNTPSSVLPIDGPDEAPPGEPPLVVSELVSIDAVARQVLVLQLLVAGSLVVRSVSVQSQRPRITCPLLPSLSARRSRSSARNASASARRQILTPPRSSMRKTAPAAQRSPPSPATSDIPPSTLAPAPTRFASRHAVPLAEIRTVAALPDPAFRHASHLHPDLITAQEMECDNQFFRSVFAQPALALDARRESP